MGNNPGIGFKNTLCDSCNAEIEDEKVYFTDDGNICQVCASEFGVVCGCGSFKKPDFEKCYTCANPGSKGYAFGSILIIICALFLGAVTVMIFESGKDAGRSRERNRFVNQVVDVIYTIEGQEKARQPFGIESIECHSYRECRKIAYNTVNNNLDRWLEIENPEDDFYTFLAKRYCPPNWEWWRNTLVEKLR